MNEKKEADEQNSTLKKAGELAGEIGSALGTAGKTAKAVGENLPGAAGNVAKGGKIVAEAIKDPSPNWVEKGVCGAVKVVAEGGVGVGVIAVKVGVEAAKAVKHPVAKIIVAGIGVDAVGKALDGVAKPVGEAAQKGCHAAFDFGRAAIDYVRGKPEPSPAQKQQQQQAAQQEQARAEARDRSANLHAERQRTQQIIANNRFFNLPYNTQYQPKPMHLVFQAQNTAQWEFRLRYGRSPSTAEAMQINSSVSSYANSFCNLSSNYGITSFSLCLMATGLINSYNSYHSGNSSIYSPWGTYGETGGVECESAIISDLIDSEAHAAADAYYLCLPTDKLPLSQNLMPQIQKELAKAFFEDNTLPFFSLHFNQQGFLYPVMHPAYQNTLIGKIIGLLDYWMKGYLNGGIFDEKFLKDWHITANCDEASLRSKMLDLKKYCKELDLKRKEKGEPALGYISLRELESRYGIEHESSSTYKQPFMTSFRIIAYQEKIERHDNIIVPHPKFKVEYSVNLMPDYKHYVEAYQKEHGRLPPAHEKMLLCYELFAREVTEKMPQLPFCKDFFNLLGVVNAHCYLFESLQKMGKRPDVNSAPLETDSFPKSLPPIPIRYYHTYPLPITFENILKSLTNTPENKMLLDAFFSGIFSGKKSKSIPEPIARVLQQSVENHIISFLKAALPPEETAELNADEVARITKTITQAFIGMASFNAKNIHKELNSWLNTNILPLSTEQKQEIIKQPLPNKIQQIKLAFEAHIKDCTTRWNKNPYLAKKQIFDCIPKPMHEDVKKIFEKVEAMILEQSTVLVAGEQALAKQIAHKASELAKIPENLRALNKANMDAFVAKQDQIIAAVKTDIAAMKQQIALFNTNFSSVPLQSLSQLQAHIYANLDNWLSIQTNFSQKLLENPTFSKKELSNKYTHTFIGFTGKKLALNAQDNFNIVGGCGMSLPNLQSQPLAHAALFSEALEQAFLQSGNDKAQFEHDGVTYSAFRMPVYDAQYRATLNLPSREAALQALEVVNNNLASTTEHLSKERIQTEVDDNGASLMHYAAATLAPTHLETLLKNTDLSLLTQADHYGNLPIHLCAQAGNLEAIASMLKIKPDLVDAKNKSGITPLMLAVQYGKFTTMEYLVTHGADANYSLPNGLYPLYMAMQKNFTPLALSLLDKTPKLELNKTLDSNMTALHLAIQSGEPFLALKLVEKGAICTIPRKSDGFTALHCAAVEGDIPLLTAMLDKGVDVNLALESGKTPLHLAAEAGNLEAVILLAARGARVDSKSVDEETALMLAIRAGQVETALWLAERVAVNAINKQGQTASQMCLQYAMSRVGDVLIRRGENPTLPDKKGFSYLYYLVRNGEYQRFVQLEKNLQFYLNQVVHGDSYLAIAAQYGHMAIVDYLLKKKAVCINTSKLSMVEYATMADDLGLLRKYKKGWPLYSLVLLAIQNKAEKSTAFLLKQMTPEERQHKALLHAAIVSNDEGILDLILKNCKDLNQPLDNEGNTPLHVAVRYGAHLALPKVAESGCDFSVLNHKNQTAFHIAVIQEDADLLKRLFKLSPEKEWPRDLWRSMPLDKDMLISRVLMKYSKRLSKAITPEAAKVEASKVSICPVLTQEQRRVLNKFEGYLDKGRFDKAATLMRQNPILLTAFLSNIGGALLQRIFENLTDPTLMVSEEGEMDDLAPSADYLLTRLSGEGFKPEHYLGRDNVLISIIESPDEVQASYKLRVLSKWFPDAVPILAEDKLGRKMSMMQLALFKNKVSLFKQLDEQLNRSPQATSTFTSSSLHEAVKAHNYDVTAELLKRHPVNSINNKGQTPLMLAASIGNIPLMELLLKFGASVNQLDFQQNNALHYALHEPHTAAALVLLPLLKEINQPNRFKLTPLMLAAAEGALPVLRFLCESGQYMPTVDDKGFNALHYAAIKGQVASLEYLASQEGFNVDEPECPMVAKKADKSRKRRPLHLAAVGAKKEAVLKLLELGANPLLDDVRGFGLCEYAVISKNKDLLDLLKLSPHYHSKERELPLLHAAVSADNKAVVLELILRETNLNAVNDRGQTALHLACINNSGEAAELLLKGGTIVVDAVDKMGESPLHDAARKGHVRLIELLVEVGGASPNQLTAKGVTALFLACSQGKSGAVLSLLKHKADFTITNPQGVTPLQEALQKGHLSIVHLLVKAGDASLEARAFKDIPENKKQHIADLRETYLRQYADVRVSTLMRYGFHPPAKARSLEQKEPSFSPGITT